MRGRRRAAVVVLVTVVAIGTAVAGCTDDGDDEAEPATTEPVGDPTEVPVAFVSPTNGWGVVGATDDLLVGLGGEAAEEAEVFGQTFDLETGALADIPAPPFDDERPVQIDTAVFGRTQVTVDAYVYGRGIDADTVPVDSGYTPPTDLVSYRLDPVERTWARLTLPVGFEDVEMRALWEIHPTGDDGAAAYFRTHGEQGTLATIDGASDRWEVVADGLPDRISSYYCATDTEWWQVESDFDSGTVSVLSLDDGASRPVETPPLVADLSIGPTIGCSAERATIAVHGGSPGSPPALYVSRDDGTWDEPRDPFGVDDVFIEDVTGGGAAGPVVFAGDMGSDPSANRRRS
ncbi:MAG TPA: hypothetical protein VK507_20305 [Iamia sp.]|nr:hypothetical protein [Iamia sp.]